jgi:hypothetical protein
MALLRYRETGEVITETEFRFRNRKRRPHNVPPMGELTEAWLEGEGVDPVFEGPRIGPVYDGAFKHSDGKWYTQWSNG